MNLIEQRYLRGPNLYASEPVLLALLAPEPGDPYSSGAAPALTRQLVQLLPSLAAALEERAVIDAAPDRATRQPGVPLATLVQEVALELQRAAGTPVAFGAVRAAERPGCWELALGYRAERVVARAIELALDLVNALLRAQPFALGEAQSELKDLTERCAIGTSTGAVLRAAHRRGIPSVRLTDEANLFLLGWGKRQRRLQATMTGNTSHVAVGIASDKQLTKSLLQEAGLPVPEGETVTSLDGAHAAAARLNGPVTIKPLDANHGKGVTTTCVSQAEIAVAYEHARQYSRRVIVERYLRGRDYRVLVTGERVAAAALRRPPQVTGDGVASVRELVELENRNPARGAGHSNILTRIALDDHALDVVRKQGADFDTVPQAGQVLALRDNANLSSGGTAEDVTDSLPQETVRICVRAARTIGLDIAGIDIVCDDIGRPLREQGGGIIEVNAAPGIRMHEYPSAGQPRDAGDAIAEALFGNSDGRIPVIAVSGSHGAGAAAGLIAQAAKVAGLVAGVASRECVRVGEAITLHGDFSGYRGARAVLSDPEVELAILDTSGCGVIDAGLGFDRADVALIVAIDAARSHEHGCHPDAELARAYEVVARCATRALVFNADDTRCVALAERLRQAQAESGGHLETLYFACQGDNPVLQQHFGRGGRGLYLQGSTLVLGIGQCHQGVLDVGPRPGTVTDLGESNITEVLAAAAALVGAGFAHQAVAAGLQAVNLSGACAPLRGLHAVNEPSEGAPVLAA